MQDIAADVGFSETVFAAPQGDGWVARYFSPETEVPFCGHATTTLNQRGKVILTVECLHMLRRRPEPTAD